MFFLYVICTASLCTFLCIEYGFRVSKYGKWAYSKDTRYTNQWQNKFRALISQFMQPVSDFIFSWLAFFSCYNWQQEHWRSNFFKKNNFTFTITTPKISWRWWHKNYHGWNLKSFWKLQNFFPFSFLTSVQYEHKILSQFFFTARRLIR